jgi:hypothetical protein
MRPSPIRRARLYAFLYFGLRRFGMHSVVDTIPILLHASLLLFFAGLIAFLLPVNQLIMYLMTAVLTLFLGIYAILTILPLIQLDCPYRTPLSGVAWKLMQLLMSPNPPDAASMTHPIRTVNDAMLEMALSNSASRDQRALNWTMESLTDNTELLPFLEAIPDAIYGVKGFHLVNAAILVPLLERPYGRLSLGDRIADLLQSCRNLEKDDPLRSQQSIAALKTIWAVALTSGTVNVPLEPDSRVLWFPESVQELVIRNQEWSAPHINSVTMAITYSHLKNLKRYISTLYALPAASDVAFMVGVGKLLDATKNVAARGCLPILNSQLELLEACRTESHSDVTKARAILERLTDEQIWVNADITLALLFIFQTLKDLSSGKELSYQYLETYLSFVPRVPDLANEPLERHVMFSDPNLPSFDPSTHQSTSNEIVNMDLVMRCFLRLVTVISPADWIEPVTMYLSRRNDMRAIRSALRDGYGHYLARHLIDALKSTHHVDITLRAIYAIQHVDGYSDHLWDATDADLWEYLTNIGGVISSSSYFCLATILTHRQLYNLQRSATEILRCYTRKDTPESWEDTVKRLETLGSHPLLQLAPNTTTTGGGSDELSPELLFSTIYRGANDAALTSLTCLLEQSISSAPPFKFGEAVHTIGIVGIHFSVPDNLQILSDFAQAWLALIKRLLENPTDPDLALAAHSMILSLRCDPGNTLHNPQTAAVFQETLSLYLHFLEQHRRDEAYAGVAGETKNQLDAVTAWMGSQFINSDGSRP